MDSSIYRFTLDMNSAQSQISIPVLLGDTGREWHINLSDGGKPYTIENGCMAMLEIKRPGGTNFNELCSIVDGSKILYDFAQNENTCIEVGVHDCDIILYGTNGRVLTSARFTMVGFERVIPKSDVIASSSDQTKVDSWALQEANRQLKETERQTAEAERSASYGKFSEEAKASAEEAKKSAEEAKEAVEEAKEAVESVDIPLGKGEGDVSVVQKVADGETENTVNGKGGITFGFDNVNNGQNVIVFGQGCEATTRAKSALCGGKGSKVNHSYTVALGRSCEANGYYSFSNGNGNKANGDSSMAFGGSNTVDGLSAGAIGSANVVSGANSVALGSSNTIGSKYSAAMGTGNAVNPLFANGGETTTGFALGSSNTVVARYNGALGSGNYVSGSGAFALGAGNNVTGHHSVALGIGHIITGEQSGAIGNNNRVDALDAFSAGVSNTIGAEATGAMALGEYLEVNHRHQIVIGIANGNKADTLFEIGNGYVGGNEVKTRKNAFEVYADGHAESYKSTDDTSSDKTLVTKDYMLSKMQSALGSYITDIDTLLGGE